MFVELARRCCEQDQCPDLEEEQELKEKALVVLLRLSHVIDGLLPNLTQRLMIMFDTALIKKEEQHERF